MHIIDISISTIRSSTNGKNILGDVTFTIERTAAAPARSVTVCCDTPISKHIRSDAVILGDAIRQLRRMPEIRSGENRLSFAPGLRPLAASRIDMDTQAADR